MIKGRQLAILLYMILFVSLAVAATHSRISKPRNLKILPQDISERMLDSIMHSYTRALNVNCVFCHTPVKSDNPNILNYESDENPTKEEARKMMRLTIG